MNIQGEKVLLRAVEIEDAEMLRNMMNDPEIEKFMGGHSFPLSKSSQMEWVKNQAYNPSILRTIVEVEGIAVGSAILTDIDIRNATAEIHIKLVSTEVRGKGYGSDAVRALTAYAFDELRLNSVYCRISESNIASQKMFLKCGYTKEGILRQRVYHGGKFHDFYQYSILRSEWDK